MFQPRHDRQSWICSALPVKGRPQLRARLDAELLEALRAYAASKRMTLSELVRRILLDYVREVSHTSKGVSHTLQRMDALIKTLELQTFQVRIAGLDTQKEREKLYETAMQLMKEAIKLSESEEAARNARARMEAMRLVNAVSRTAVAILTGYDRAAIEALLQEIKRGNEFLQRELRALTEGATGEPSKDREKKT